jgi:small subunit ribosomal protein S6
MEEQIHPYESVIIMKQDASEDIQKNLFKKNRDIIKNHNGELNHVDSWGKRMLGNPVKRNFKGHFFHSTFTGNNKTVAELERTMRINENVIRFMHTRLEDGTNFEKYLNEFKENIKKMRAADAERETKMAARRQQRN